MVVCKTKKSAELLGRIEDHNTYISYYINKGRYQKSLIKDTSNWNQICSSLDAVKDTLVAIYGFMETDFPENLGVKYIYPYGILQLLFVQQDAVQHLAEAFKIEFIRPDSFKTIRHIRNKSIGHPTNKRNKDGTTHHFIDRHSIKKDGFTILNGMPKGEYESEKVSIPSLIYDQLVEVERICSQIAEELRETDKMHKKTHKERQLENTFHSNMNYYFGKVAEAIGGKNVELGITLLISIRASYESFGEVLLERNELDDHIKSDLDEYRHAISKLEGYLETEEETIPEMDARIYHFYICERHKHFIKIAREIDKEYAAEE